MMLEHMGWDAAAGLIRAALQTAVRAGEVTYDLARQIDGAREVSCSRFAELVVENMK
jgi:isocitrate dehydrogenase